MQPYILYLTRAIMKTATIVSALDQCVQGRRAFVVNPAIDCASVMQMRSALTVPSALLAEPTCWCATCRLTC
jgi:hypothetical protein